MSLFAQELGDLNGIGGSALADLVATAPEGDAAQGVGVGDVAAHTADQMRSWSVVSSGMGQRSCADSAARSSKASRRERTRASRACSSVMSRSN